MVWSIGALEGNLIGDKGTAVAKLEMKMRELKWCPEQNE